MAGQVFQQVASMGPEAAQSLTSGPGQLLTSAPQQLASAPQQLGSLLSQFAGNTGSSGTQAAMPSVSAAPPRSAVQPGRADQFGRGAFGSGRSRPMMPSTWGAQPVTEPTTNAARAITPVATGMPGGAGASGSGAGGGGAMGAGAHNSGSRSKKVHTYADDAVDEDADADSDGGLRDEPPTDQPRPAGSPSMPLRPRRSTITFRLKGTQHGFPPRR